MAYVGLYSIFLQNLWFFNLPLESNKQMLNKNYIFWRFILVISVLNTTTVVK